MYITHNVIIYIFCTVDIRGGGGGGYTKVTLISKYTYINSYNDKLGLSYNL